MSARRRRAVRALALSAALASGLGAVAVVGAGSAAAAEPNGCGPSSWKVDVVPDGFGRADFRPPCDDHDVCYGADSPVSRAACDDAFRTGLEDACDEAYDWADLEEALTWVSCRKVVLGYAYQVRDRGEPYYAGSGDPT